MNTLCVTCMGTGSYWDEDNHKIICEPCKGTGYKTGVRPAMINDETFETAVAVAAEEFRQSLKDEGIYTPQVWENNIRRALLAALTVFEANNEHSIQDKR